MSSLAKRSGPRAPEQRVKAALKGPVRVGEVVKGAGPRAPEQRVMPKPKGPVELPEGRPVTKMQLIEVDPEFLLELERGLIEGEQGDETGDEAAEVQVEMYKVRVERIPNYVPPDDAPSQPIGGWDQNFPHVEHHADVINRFFSRVAERWPAAIFIIHDDSPQREPRLKLRKSDLPVLLPVEGTAFIMRDDEMDAHEARMGAVPMPDGESSLMLLFNPNPNAPGFYYLDLVTVSDPLEHEFSWWAAEQLWDVYLTSKKEHQVPEQEQQIARERSK